MELWKDIGLIKCGYSLIFRQTCDNVAGCIATSSLSSTNGDFKGGAGPLLQTKPGICVYIINAHVLYMYLSASHISSN